MTARNEREANQHLSTAAEARDAERARWARALAPRSELPSQVGDLSQKLLPFTLPTRTWGD